MQPVDSIHMPLPASTPSPLRKTFFVFAYGALLTFLLAMLYQSVLAGGNPWQQADWLINFEAGPIRRGLGGHILLSLSDALGLDLLHVLGVVQAALVSVLVIGIGWAIYAIGIPDRLFILAISPGFLPFWAYDYLGSMRKEMVAILAFLPLLRPAQHPEFRAVISLTIFAIAVLLHEGNGFVAPFLAATLWITLLRHQWLFGAAAFAIAGAGFAIALSLPSINDAAPICQAVTERGFRETFCGGSIRWLEFDLARVLQENTARIETFGFPVTVFVSYALAIIPLAATLRHAPKWALPAAVLSGLLLAPLYVVALDWGRWVFLHIACVTLVILAYVAHRPAPWATLPMERTWFVFLLIASGAWSMSFYTGETNVGLAGKVIALF